MLTGFVLAAAAAFSLVASVFAYREARDEGGMRWAAIAVGLVLASIALSAAAVSRTMGLGIALLFALAALALAGGVSRRLESKLKRPAGPPTGLGEPEFRRLVEHGWDAFVLVDPDGMITFASESVRRLLGTDATEVVGRAIFDVLFAGDADAGGEQLREVLRQPGRRGFHEFRAIDASGSTVWLEATWTNLINDSSIGGVVVNLRDVTDRKKADAALEESESGYRRLVEHALYGVYRWDPKGRFLAVNPALVRMLGYDSEKELLAVDAVDGVYADPSQAQELIERYRNADRIEGVEVEWQRKDGSRFSVWLSGQPLHDARGDLIAFEMMAEDVTERRTLEAQLRQAQKMEAIGQLAGGIAHDFNNLLTVVLANSDIIEAVVGDTENPIRDELDDIRRSAQRGRDLVKKLLGYGRRDMLEAKPINLVGFVQDLLPTLKRVLPASIDLRLSASIAEPIVHADTGALQHILFNLATNACDAMPQGGTIRLELGIADSDSRPKLAQWGARGEFVRLSVSDNGTGMDDQTMGRVFDPFFTTKAPGVGTGLGMSMVYGLLKQHDGFIDVESTEGEGTTVVLFFPTASVVPEEAQRTMARASATEGTETILVVEDESAIRRSVKRLLEKKGYRVLLAEDGQEALEVFERIGDSIDLVVSDVVMPRLGGFELFQAIRDRGDEVRFLFVSGYATPKIKQLASEASQTFLQKPWDVEDFLQRVRELLDMGAAGRPAA